MEEHRTLNTEHRTSKVERRGQAGVTEQVYDLEERLLNDAAEIIKFSQKLPSSRANNHVAGQLLRSGTSPLSNHGEAEAAESHDDHVHKLKVCLKELRESLRWIRLVPKSQLLPEPQILQHALDKNRRVAPPG